MIVSSIPLNLQLSIQFYSLIRADFDECQLDLDNCDENADCMDTIGNYTCSCHFGYSSVAETRLCGRELVT